MRFAYRSLSHFLIAALIGWAVVAATYIASVHGSLDTLASEAERRSHAVVAGLFISTEKFGGIPGIVSEHAVLAAAVAHPAERGRTARANQYLSELAQNLGVDVIFLMDRSGRTIAASNWDRHDSFVGENYAFRPYFKQALKGGTGKFYGLGVSSEIPGYYLSAPVRTAGDVHGVLVFKTDLAHLDDAWNLDSRVEVAVTDELGISFLSSRPDWKYRPLHALTDTQVKTLDRTRQYNGRLRESLRLRILATLSSDSTLVELASTDGYVGRPEERQRFVLHSRAIPDTGWTAQLFLPTEPVEARAVLHAALAGLAVVVAWVTCLYAVAQSKRHAEQLAAHQELTRSHAELQALNVRLRHQTTTDPMLGCYNRSYFFEQITKLLSSAQRHANPLSIVMLDVDHFKSINDTYGHLVGDAVLRRIVELCASDMREEDVFARFGGEEFIFALPLTGAEAALAFCERLRRRIAAENFEPGSPSPFQVTASFGVAQLHDHDPDHNAVIRRADTGLYEAKRSGRNRVVLTAYGALTVTPEHT